jgi:SsrA-binding protein
MREDHWPWMDRRSSAIYPSEISQTSHSVQFSEQVQQAAPSKSQHQEWALPYNAPMAKQKKTPSNQIAQNKKARFDYHIEETFEAGLSLEGWEVKSIRAGQISLKESYVLLKKGEAWLFGAHITPLLSASTHVNPDPTRLRKLLLHSNELNKIIGAVERKGYSVLPLDLHWRRGKVKAEIGIGKGKKEFDKRATQKERDWNREKQRELKTG